MATWVGALVYAYDYASVLWNWVVAPVGKSVVTKIYAYAYPEQTKDAMLEEEFFKHLRSQNVRVYEVVSPPGGRESSHESRPGVTTRYLILETPSVRL